MVELEAQICTFDPLDRHSISTPLKQRHSVSYLKVNGIGGATFARPCHVISRYSRGKVFGSVVQRLPHISDARWTGGGRPDSCSNLKSEWLQ